MIIESRRNTPLGPRTYETSQNHLLFGPERPLLVSSNVFADSEPWIIEQRKLLSANIGITKFMAYDCGEETIMVLSGGSCKRCGKEFLTFTDAQKHLGWIVPLNKKELCPKMSDREVAQGLAILRRLNPGFDRTEKLLMLPGPLWRLSFLLKQTEDGILHDAGVEWDVAFEYKEDYLRAIDFCIERLNQFKKDFETNLVKFESLPVTIIGDE